MRNPEEYSDFYTVAKSNQLNASDLIAGDVTAKVERVRGLKADGKVQITLSGGHMPWVLSKTMVRLLTELWGARFADWPGRWVRLYNDPDVTYGKDRTGGIRVNGVTDIPKSTTVTLMTRRGQYTTYEIEALKAPKQEGAPTANLAAYIIEAGLTIEAIDAWRATNDKPPVSEMTDEHRAKFAGWLAGNDKALHEIRGLMATMGATDEGGE